MIPKIIHYCWFGKGMPSKEMLRCIDSWKRYLPDYQIIQWNEDNFDVINENEYVREAYHQKKYAFVSDYVRIKVLYDYGGIYFDTDYELCGNISRLLEAGDFISGFESKNSLLTAIIASKKGHPFLKEFLNTYNYRKFVLKNNELDLTPINIGFSQLAKSYGIELSRDCEQNGKYGFHVYPREILCGFDVENWHECVTKSTIGIHHMDNSWASSEMKKHIKWIKFLQRVLGYKLYDKIGEIRRKRR